MSSSRPNFKGNTDGSFSVVYGGMDCKEIADERGVKEISERLGELASQFGDRFQAAPLIVKIAGNGGRFYEDAA